MFCYQNFTEVIEEHIDVFNTNIPDIIFEYSKSKCKGCDEYIVDKCRYCNRVYCEYCIRDEDYRAKYEDNYDYGSTDTSYCEVCCEDYCAGCFLHYCGRCGIQVCTLCQYSDDHKELVDDCSDDDYCGTF